MPDPDPTPLEQTPRSTVWQTALTMLQAADPPFIPEGAHAMTVAIVCGRGEGLRRR